MSTLIACYLVLSRYLITFLLLFEGLRITLELWGILGVIGLGFLVAFLGGSGVIWFVFESNLSFTEIIVEL